MVVNALNSKQKRKIVEGLTSEYGVGNDVFRDFVVFEIGSDIWVASRQCFENDLDGLRIESVGLRVMREGVPTINGLQLLFKGASLTELTEEDAKAFISGGKVESKGVLAYGGQPIDLGDRKSMKE